MRDQTPVKIHALTRTTLTDIYLYIIYIYLYCDLAIQPIVIVYMEDRCSKGEQLSADFLPSFVSVTKDAGGASTRKHNAGRGREWTRRNIYNSRAREIEESR